jgi:hypothetical protein
MTDTLLFLHLLSAAALFAAIAGYSAVVLGTRVEPGPFRTFVGLWRVGILGVLVFGIALAIDIDGYELWDAWVLIAIVLWLLAGLSAERLRAAYEDGGPGVAIPSGLANAHWLSVAVVLLLLADMIWKPFA